MRSRLYAGNVTSGGLEDVIYKFRSSHESHQNVGHGVTHGARDIQLNHHSSSIREEESRFPVTATSSTNSSSDSSLVMENASLITRVFEESDHGESSDTEDTARKAASADSSSREVQSLISLSSTPIDDDSSVTTGAPSSAASSSHFDCHFTVEQEDVVVPQEVACILELPLNSFDWDTLLGTSDFSANFTDDSTSFTFMTLQ